MTGEENYERLAGMQQLVAEIALVERNHRMVGTDRPENVVEHSFGVALLAWRIHDALGLKLDMAKVLKYSMVHDFSERGQAKDVNSFASQADRQAKRAREVIELARMMDSFSDFEDFTETLTAYEAQTDDESQFVWTVDKIQALVHGKMDDWHPYITCGASYDDYCNKGTEWLARAYPPVQGMFAEIIEHGRQFYFEQPR